MQYFVVIPADSDISCYSTSVDADTLQQMQSIVGGYIETVLCGNNNLLIVNEEGKINSLPYNARATELVGPLDVIFGDAILATKGFKNGEPDIVGFDDKEFTDDFADLINHFGKGKGATNAGTSEAPKA